MVDIKHCRLRAFNVVFVVLLTAGPLQKRFSDFIVRMFRDTASECAVHLPFVLAF